MIDHFFFSEMIMENCCCSNGMIRRNVLVEEAKPWISNNGGLSFNKDSQYKFIPPIFICDCCNSLAVIVSLLNDKESDLLFTKENMMMWGFFIGEK
jgi:hypothetical protein